MMKKIYRNEGQSVRIPLGAKHRAWNESDESIIFIEVQTGTYFGEDDIIRIEDDYGRI
jgi:mannose-6-phosphate isomerase